MPVATKIREAILAGTAIVVAIAAATLLLIWKFSPSASAQLVQNEFPTAQNPIVARVFDSGNRPTDILPLITVANGQLHVSVPEPKSSFRPGKYRLDLWIWQNGVIYFTGNDFTWGVVDVNFNKSIYSPGNRAHVGFGVLDDAGRTVCDAAIGMDVVFPSGKAAHFSTDDGSITRSSSCGPATVTSKPDYSSRLTVSEVGTYNASVVVTTPNGTRRISDGFEVQAPPLFDVERIAPTRIYPPAPYGVSLLIKANEDYAGTITETVPASFGISAPGAQIVSVNETQTISWPVNLRKGESASLSYSFKAPNMSPELYKLGPLQIGNWQESRQWQIAADSISNMVIFIASTASTTWTVPNDWNNSSNTIEVIGGGGGGSTGAGSGGTGNEGGGGGGGGAYAKITNFSTSTGNSIKIEVGGGGAANNGGATTYFNWSGSGSTSTCSGSTMSVCATAGGTGVFPAGGTGGASSTSSGTVKNGGGVGGAGQSSHNTNAGGGGGSAGPNGDGNAGQSSIGTSAGGSGDAGSGGGGGVAGSPPTSNGGNGTEYTSNPGGLSGGAGGGGGGSNVNNTAGGAGGSYGAGGGGGRSTGGAGGAGSQGIIIITYTPLTITLGDGTQPAGVTIGPGANATTSAVFTFQTNNGTSTIALATTTISTSTGIYQVQIANDAGTVVYGSSTNPTGTTNSISLSGMNVSTTLTQFRILIKPLGAVSMPAVPGGTYAVTSTLSAWTDSKNLDQAGANTTSSVVTIDNQSPADVTNASGTAGSAQVLLSWTNPGDSDFATTTVLRATSSITVAPTEGVSYNAGDSIDATTTVACVVSSSASSCTDTGVTNGNTYYYKIFSADKFLNYSAGIVPTGNPFTPASVPPSVSNVVLNHGNQLILTPNVTTSFDVNYTVTDPAGCSDIVNTTSTAFRGGASSACAVPNPATSSSNCYLYATHVTSTCSGNAFNATDTVGLYYFAQSTGNASSSFPSDHWYAYASAMSASNATGTATSSGVDVGVLLALNVTTSSINYGTVPASSTTGSTNQAVTIQNVGNASQTLKIYGTALSLGADLVATSSQHYATSSFAYGGVEQVLSDVAQAVSGFFLPAPTSTSAVQNNIFWGIGISAGKSTGTYGGTNTFTAIWSQ